MHFFVEDYTSTFPGLIVNKFWFLFHFIYFVIFQTLVAEVSVTLLQFASFQPMNINPSADTPLSYAVEKLPASVTSGLARIAQYAPEALRDSLNSAVFSGTDLSLGGGAGGGYSYGVFDGLAPQPYLYSLPVLHSPPHSPGKVISQRGNYTSPESRNAGGGGLSNTVSPNLGYAVQSVEDDEDEF